MASSSLKNHILGAVFAVALIGPLSITPSVVAQDATVQPVTIVFQVTFREGGQGALQEYSSVVGPLIGKMGGKIISNVMLKKERMGDSPYDIIGVVQFDSEAQADGLVPV